MGGGGGTASRLLLPYFFSTADALFPIEFFPKMPISKGIFVAALVPLTTDG